MKRTHYRNGDEVSLHTGCDGCSPAAINGVFCHETGCREAWRDTTIECRECGCDFLRENRYDAVCPGCANPEPDEPTPADDEAGMDEEAINAEADRFDDERYDLW